MTVRDLPVYPMSVRTVLYHSTRSDGLEEATEALQGPAWFSDIALDTHWFATSGYQGDGSAPRCITYETTTPLTLLLIRTRVDWQRLLDHYDVVSPAELADCLPVVWDGWYAPLNYPAGGADICVRTPPRVLRYLATTLL